MKISLFKFTLIAAAGLLLQACAPDQELKKVDESWLRVTPVDIAEEQQQQQQQEQGQQISAPAAAAQENVSVFDAQSVSVYRFANGFTGSRMSTLSAAQPNFWIAQGESFKIFKNAGADRDAVYACVVPNTLDYFSSRDANCEGRQKIGLLGYLEKAASTNAPRAVYRCFGRLGHIDTVNSSECAALGYNVEAILGYTR